MGSQSLQNQLAIVAPDFVDPGLGGFLKNAGYPVEVYMAEWGKHKVPTLPNVDLLPALDLVKAYGYHGYFKTLEVFEISRVTSYRFSTTITWPRPILFAQSTLQPRNVCPRLM